MNSRMILWYFKPLAQFFRVRLPFALYAPARLLPLATDFSGKELVEVNAELKAADTLIAYQTLSEQGKKFAM
jgi:hypothetical protein